MVISRKKEGIETTDRFLSVREINELIATNLGKVGFEVICNRIFDREPPPMKIGQIIFCREGQAVINRMRVEDAGFRWFQLSWLTQGEANGQLISDKLDLGRPQAVRISQTGDNGFRVSYDTAFPARETKDQIVSAINALVRFYNHNFQILRVSPFVSPFNIEIVPPNTREARLLANIMGALAKSYCLAWLTVQMPDIFPVYQIAELETIAKDHKWIFKQGEPLLIKKV